MIYKYQYNTVEDRNNCIALNSDKTLVEEQNIVEGNFLIFTDEQPIEIQLSEVKENQMILMDAMATMYEDMLMKGTV